MFLLLIFLALIIIATYNFAPQIAETFGFWNTTIESEPKQPSLETNEVESSDHGAFLRKYPHYTLNDD